jgi:hypothetical protein
MSGDQAEAVAAEATPSRGRPSSYSPELAEAICNLIVEGNSLRAIEDIDGMPSKTSILRWAAKNTEFRDQYARACEARTDAHADEILAIADDGQNDWMQKNHGENLVWVENGEALRRSQLRIDARKWLMSKMAPKKYGEKVSQEISGKDGGPIENVHLVQREIIRR